MSPAGNALPGRGISLRFIGWIISIFALVVASMLVVSTILITNENTVVSKANSNYLELREESFNVQKASDYLTEQVRLFVVEGNEKYMDAYFKEAKETKGMPTAIIMKSVKGKGVSFMENQAGWHGKAPNDEQYEIAMEDLKKVGEALCQK